MLVEVDPNVTIDSILESLDAYDQYEDIGNVDSSDRKSMLQMLKEIDGKNIQLMELLMLCATIADMPVSFLPVLTSIGVNKLSFCFWGVPTDLMITESDGKYIIAMETL